MISTSFRGAPCRTVASAAGLVLLGLTLLAAADRAEAQERRTLPKPHPDLPEDFRQLMPRGGIPAVDDPQFVSAREADIPGDAWVLGVEADGQAKAYSLELLNSHEVVNDRIGERPIAAVW